MEFVRNFGFDSLGFRWFSLLLGRGLSFNMGGA